VVTRDARILNSNYVCVIVYIVRIVRIHAILAWQHRIIIIIMKAKIIVTYLNEQLLCPLTSSVGLACKPRCLCTVEFESKTLTAVCTVHQAVLSLVVCRHEWTAESCRLILPRV